MVVEVSGQPQSAVAYCGSLIIMVSCNDGCATKKITRVERYMMAKILPSRKLVSATPDVASETVWCQLKSLFGTVGASPLRRRLAWLALGIGVVICVNMVG